MFYPCFVGWGTFSAELESGDLQHQAVEMVVNLCGFSLEEGWSSFSVLLGHTAHLPQTAPFEAGHQEKLTCKNRPFNKIFQRRSYVILLKNSLVVFHSEIFYLTIQIICISSKCLQVLFFKIKYFKQHKLTPT